MRRRSRRSICGPKPIETNIIGTSCTSPMSPTAIDESVSVVDLDEERDQRELAADLRDQLARPEQPEIARLRAAA